MSEMKHARWVREGSPNGQFDELGTFGGRLWRVRVDDDGNTTFLLRAIAGPTDPGYNKPAEDWQWGQSGRGFEVEMAFKGGGMVFREGAHPNDLVIDTEPIPYHEEEWTPEEDYD